MWLSDRIFLLLSKLSGRDIQKSEDVGTSVIECDNMNSLLDVRSESDAIAITSYEVLAQSLNKDNISMSCR